MKYLIAFDSFKGSLSAPAASELADHVLKEADGSAETDLAPLTDGGEGFATIINRALEGTLHELEVPGPRFAPVTGRFAMVDGQRIPEAAWTRLQLPQELAGGKIAVVEMASASGYESLGPEERDPWQASTYGTGVLIKTAAEAGAGAIILGIGGSATNDCGAGALEALGVCYYDKDLQPVRNIVPARLKEVHTLGATSHMLNAFPPVRIACDVTNSLLGPEGATRVFGPQKGLREADFERMERTMSKMGTRILGLFGRNPAEWDRLLNEPGGGAAGGIGFALRHALPDSRFVEGFPLVSGLLDLPARIRAAGCLVTGEGRLDASSLRGKGPVALLRLADATTRVLLFAGSVDESVSRQLQAAHPNLEIHSISDPAWPLEEALRRAPAALEAALQKAVGAVS